MTALSARLAWPWRRPRVGLAFSRTMLLALGTREGGRALKAEIPPGTITPAVAAPNIQSMREVARLASEMIDELGGRGGEAAVLLPDLTIVSALVPASRAIAERELGPELAPRLGFPPSEARSDFWRGRKGEVLAAAVRESVVRQYEQVVEAAECRLGWVDGASLVRVPAWVESSGLEPSAGVRLQLYRSHYVLAVFRAGELVDLRTRLRSSEDVDTIADEVLRLPAIYDLPSLGPVRVSGQGAAACVDLLREARGLGRLLSEEEGEESQLEAALGALLRRN
ncbi:MAG: hypothetical protein ACRD21_17220 [Vicinamibacteria bacterium]